MNVEMEKNLLISTWVSILKLALLKPLINKRRGKAMTHHPRLIALHRLKPSLF